MENQKIYTKNKRSLFELSNWTEVYDKIKENAKHDLKVMNSC